MEFGYLAGPESQMIAGRPSVTGAAVVAEGNPDHAPLEFSPSAEARMIGPAPIAWLGARRGRADN